MEALPTGFNLVQGGTFTPFAGSSLGNRPIQVEDFGMAEHHVTNAEWNELVGSLGEERFVLLDSDPESRCVRYIHRYRSLADVSKRFMTGGFYEVYEGGGAFVTGSKILVNMVSNPAVRIGEKFGGAERAVVGITYFHMLAWCYMKSNQNPNSMWRYTLPTDVEFEYVASDRGTKKYGTNNGKFLGRLVELYSRVRYSRAVAKGERQYPLDIPLNDDSFPCPTTEGFPFGIRITGNVWHRTLVDPSKMEISEKSKMETSRKSTGGCFDLYGSGKEFGLRGGSAFDFPWWGHGLATRREFANPFSSSYNIGFIPVVHKLTL